MLGSMVVGAVFSRFFDRLGFTLIYLIAMMLFVTFCRISLRQMKVTRLHWVMLAFQLLGGAAIYLLIFRLNPVVAQGLMICIFTSVAMGAVVIGGMLGADITTMATFTMMSNLGVVVAAPLLFSAIGASMGGSFIESALLILAHVGPLLALPFIGAWLLEKFWPAAHSAVKRNQGISFWLWVVSLTIVIARTVRFLIGQPAENHITEIWLAVGALAICLPQFAIGRYLGRRYGDTAAGGQSMGQKNTVLAIWMSQTFLDPLSSIAPAAYVLWQNLVNSWQLWKFKNN